MDHEVSDAGSAPAQGDDFHARTVDALPGIVYVYDLGTQHVVFVSSMVERALGYSASQVRALGADLLPRLVHPEDLARVRAHLTRVAAFADGAHALDEYRLQDSRGRWCWFESRDAVFARGPDGRATQLLGVAAEIGARKRAELSLIQNESQLRRQVDSAPMAVIECDAGRRITRWAGEAERMFGWRAAEVLGLPLGKLHLIHGDDIAEVQRTLAPLLAGQVQHVISTNRNLTKDQRVIHCTWRNSRIAGADGSTESLLSLVLDVTEQQRAEEALRGSEERHRLLAETMLQGVVHQAADGRIIAMNPAATRILGKSREQLLGSDSVREEHDTIREDGSPFPGDEHPSMTALRTGEPVRGVVMGVWNQQLGQRRWIRIDSVPVRRPGGTRPAEVYAVFEDITEARQREEALREAGRQKDMFIATLAHELRNPLAPILNAARMLRHVAPANAAVLRGGAVIERQVAQMARLLDDLLDVSRTASGRVQLRREPLQLASVIGEAVETALPLIEAAGHELVLDLPAEPVTLAGDRVRLAQVCANLLTNAAKYTQAHGRIEVHARHVNDSVEIRVRDSGIGLAREHLDSVFQMFGQVDAAIERSQGGLGIGLALARGLVELHGGSISAHSDGPGRGSEFVVRLPAPPLPAPALPAPAALPRPAPPVGRQVLVVDDNGDAADTLALLLTSSGHTVRTANDGEQALECVTALRPEVALLDIGLPRMNGFELCRALRALPGGAEMLIVAISGWGQPRDRERSAEAGFDAHFVKPVAFEQLEALLAAPR